MPLTSFDGCVSENAVAVVDELRTSGYEAYLVGGCVRDLLLGREPKDFDVATSATPEQVKEVFPRARLVGRRFRIAHVRMRREIIEVSTFRRHVDPDDEILHDNERSEQGVILRDNVYGTLEEDAFRRDFTVNALYYDPTTEELLDFVDGFDDLARKRLKLIGEPLTRFREDPVRILRAIRFAAKLGFELDAETEEAIGPMSELLTAIPPARLFDEFLKLFMSGNAVAAWNIMMRYELPEILFPVPPGDASIVTEALASTDARVREDKPVTPGFLLAALLWDEFQNRAAESATSRSAADDRTRAAHAVIAEQQHTIAIPRRFSMFVRDVWNLQPKLEKRTSRNLGKTLEHQRFRAAYDFLLLRVATGEIDPEIGQFWTDIQETGQQNGRQTAEGSDEQKPRRRRRRRRRGRGSRPRPENPDAA